MHQRRSLPIKSRRRLLLGTCPSSPSIRLLSCSALLTLTLSVRLYARVRRRFNCLIILFFHLSFLSRLPFFLFFSQLVVMPYAALLSRESRSAMGVRLEGAVVVVDEAHNIVEAINAVHSKKLVLSEVTKTEITGADDART